MTDDRGRHSFSEVAEVGLDDWRMLFRALHARFLTKDFATGLALVARIGCCGSLERLRHHPAAPRGSTRMRGLRTEYRRSTPKLMST